MQFFAEGPATWEPIFLMIGIGVFGILTFLSGLFGIGSFFELDMSKSSRVRSGTLLTLVSVVFGAATFSLIQGIDAARPQQAVIAEVQRVYGIPISADVASNLATTPYGASIHLGYLVAGGQEQMIEHYGSAEFLVDDERYNLSLAWVADEWVLLEGDPADLNELERVAGS